MYYILLALTGLLPAARIIYRRRGPALLATTVVAAAFVHTADWLASGVLGLYKYHPGLFSDLVLDDAAGVVLAEFFFVTSLAVVLVTQVASWWGALIGVAIVTLLEWMFEPLGLLEYQGWELWLTSGGFFVYFLLVQRYWLVVSREWAPAGWPYTLARVALAVLFSGMFHIILWATRAAHMPVFILPAEDENQALLRFLWHALISVPLVYWATESGRHGGSDCSVLWSAPYS